MILAFLGTWQTAFWHAKTTWDVSKLVGVRWDKKSTNSSGAGFLGNRMMTKIMT